MSLRDNLIKSEYRSLKDNVIQDFYIPLLSEAISYKRAVGFFSSTALIEVTKGISNMAMHGGKIYVVASPYLSDEDIEAISKGYLNRNKVIEDALLRQLYNEHTDYYSSERLNLLANLIAYDILDIRIAYMENKSGIGMYHEKMGIIEDVRGYKVAFSGSMNATAAAMSINYETIDVYHNWGEENDIKRVELKEKAFDSIWNNSEPNIQVLEFPNISKALIDKYRRKSPNYNIDIEQFSKKSNSKLSFVREYIDVNHKTVGARVPNSVDLYDYQKEAISEWVGENYRGIYDMATGERVIIVMGAINALKSRVLGTLVNMIHALLRVIRV